MATRIWITVVGIVLVFGRLTCAEPSRVTFLDRCSRVSVTDSILQVWDSLCPVNAGVVGVTEGDEVSLQRALNIVHKNKYDYVAVLFYASWCPFSRTCRPSFTILSSLYPSIPHFAVKESTIKPSTLSKYGVHGFPTLFLLNSTVRVRYHGSRTLPSLFAFYSDVTGIRTSPLDQASLYETGQPSKQEEHGDGEEESCPFSWARSPENMLRHETYLALATTFVLLRFLYLVYPFVVVCGRRAWSHSMSLRSLRELPLAYFNRALQVFNSLKEPCKRSNLQEGAMNARAWASKSLASAVSIGEASTSRSVPLSQRH